MKEYFIDDGYLRVDFDSNVDLYDYIRSKAKEGNWSYIGTINERANSKWGGGFNYEQSMTNLLYGNKDITERFIEGFGNIKDEKDTNTNVFMDTEGFAYDMGAVVNGEPECCVNFGTPENKISINILLDSSFPANIKGDCIERRGIALANLINSLILKGIIVNLKVIKGVNLGEYGINSGKEVRKSIMTVKVPTESLSLGSLAQYCSCEYTRNITILVQSMFHNLPDNAGDTAGFTSDSDYDCVLTEKNSWLIPNAFKDSRVEYLKTQEEADEYVKGLFKEFCEKNNLKLEE